MDTSLAPATSPSGVPRSLRRAAAPHNDSGIRIQSDFRVEPGRPPARGDEEAIRGCAGGEGARRRAPLIRLAPAGGLSSSAPFSPVSGADGERERDALAQALAANWRTRERSLRAAATQILVVEDDPVIRRILAVLLKGAGYRVDTAGSGGAGWVALCANCYDLLLTDHLMPQLTGLDLIRRVRAVPLNLPCVLMAGDPPPFAPDLAQLLQPGALLAKPFSLPDALATVGEALAAAETAALAVSTEQWQMAGSAR
jgi:CheY-like chemotaxis protein